MEIINYHSQTQHILYSLLYTIYIMLRSHIIQYIPINLPTAFTLPLLQLGLTHILQCLRDIPAPSRAPVSPGITCCSMDLSTAPVHLRCTFSSMVSMGHNAFRNAPTPTWLYPWLQSLQGSTCSVVVLSMATHFEVLQHDHMHSHRCFASVDLFLASVPSEVCHNHGT